MSRYATTPGITRNQKYEQIIHLHVMYVCGNSATLGSSMTFVQESGKWVIDRSWDMTIKDDQDLVLMKNLFRSIVGIEPVNPIWRSRSV